jgi:hypothetical protein
MPTRKNAAPPDVPRTVRLEDYDVLLDRQLASVMWVPRGHAKGRYVADYVALERDGGRLSLAVAKVRMEKRDGAWGAEDYDVEELPLDGGPADFGAARRVMNPERARVMAMRLLAHLSGDADALRRVGVNGYMLLARAMVDGPRSNPRRARAAAKRR